MTNSSHKPRKKIAILRTSSIGDVVLSTWCLDLNHYLEDSSEIVWLGHEPTLSWVKYHFPQISTLNIKEKNITECIKALKDVDAFLNLQMNFFSFLLAFFFYKEYRKPTVGMIRYYLWRNYLIFKARVLGRSRTLPFEDLIPPRSVKEAVRNAFLKIRKNLGLKTPTEKEWDEAEFLDTSSDNRLRVIDSGQVFEGYLKEAFLDADTNWIGLAVGASYPTKSAPVFMFREIIQILTKRIEVMELENTVGPKKLGIVFLGDEKDNLLVEKLLGQINWPSSLVNLCGKLSLLETSWVLSKVKVLLSNDSGLVHIAESYGVPTGVLFGPTIEGFGFAPSGINSRGFSAPLGCRPCSKHGKIPCRFGDNKCFTDIPRSQVVEFLVDHTKEK